MKENNYIRKLFTEDILWISLTSLGLSFVSMLIYGFFKIPYCQNKSSFSYDYCIKEEANLTFGNLAWVTILFFIVWLVVIYLFLIIKNQKKIKTNISNMSKENERRLKFEEKFKEEERQERRKKELEEKEITTKQNKEYDIWVTNVEIINEQIETKDYITIAMDSYDYLLLHIWFENGNYNLFVNSTDKSVYEKAILGDKSKYLLETPKLELKVIQNSNSYERNPKKTATIKGAILAGSAGAIVGASSTNETKETVTVDTNKCYYLKCDKFESQISKKDYEFLKKYINYNNK